MSTPNILIESALAQAPVKTINSAKNPRQSGQVWLFASIGLLLLLIGLAIYGKLKIDDMAKKLKFEQFKTTDLQKN